MLASLLSLPSAAVSGTASFLANRRKGLTYTAGALGGAYVLGQWAIHKVVESAERGRKENWERDDLTRRFSLNLQDSQFTVLALVPTVATQLQHELDVEARSKALSDLARREKERRAEEAHRAQEEEEAKAKAAQEEEERVRAEEERRRHEAEHAAGEATAGVTGEAVESQEPVSNGEADLPDESAAAGLANGGDESAYATPSSAPSSSNGDAVPPAASASLNPAAPAFQPRATPPPAPEPASASADEPAFAASIVEQDGSGSVLGKSWAEVVKTAPPAQDAPVVVADEPAPTVEANGVHAEEPVEATNPVANGEPNGAKEKEPAAPSEPEVQQPEKSKVELWSEIKLLSFTRLVTSLYVLVLLSLQTHVQLALLGRASYVDSLLSTLPPRTPSPRSSTLPLSSADDLPEALKPSDIEDPDLERALYEAKRLPPTADERVAEKEQERKDLERKYLTFSWWLLHEGWKVVRDRVEGAVEGVVGPMGLKAPLVYGELGALFGEIRRRIEQDEDGKPFDFSPAIHPPTIALEIQTLISGGSYVPSPPPSSSSASFPPTARRSSPDPITPSLRSLLNETNDALDSPDGALVRALSLDRVFALVVEKLEPAFTTPAPGADESRGARFEDVTEKQARLAGILPLVTRLAASEGGVLSSGVNGNEFVDALEDVRELREFSAVLYGSWDRDNLGASCVL
ncbi:peroxin [Rhodotorula kratochvilovae]